MLCPKCDKDRLAYNQKRELNDNKLDHIRTDFSVKCIDCNYEGVEY